MADLARIAGILNGTKWMPLEQAQAIERLALNLKPTRVLEIGTLHGAGSCYLGVIAADYGGQVWTVDLPLETAEYQRNPLAEELLEKCGLTNVSVIRRADGAEGWLRDFFKAHEPPLDLIYLDGGHEWNTTAAQLALSWGALRIGGWVVMDDVDNKLYPDVGEIFRVVVPCLAGLHYRMGNWGFAMKLPPREYVPTTYPNAVIASAAACMSFSA